MIVTLIAQQQNRFTITATGGTPEDPAGSYSLAASAKTSAGIFTLSGTLVRTLWGGVDKAAGTYSTADIWDGKDDQGTLVADGSYEFLVTENKIEDEWGVIGNSSTYNTGATVQHTPSLMASFAIAGGYCYYAVNYNEGNPTVYKFNLNTPQQKEYVVPGPGQATSFIATDGVYVFHGGMGYSPEQYIVATKVSDDSLATFANGVSKTSHWGMTYPSAIDVTSTTVFDGNPDNNTIPLLSIGGMVAQTNANKYLFVSYFDRNEIHAIDIHTMSGGNPSGAVVQTITTFTTPGALAVDANNNLWICSGTNTVTRHTVNSNGTLSAATLTLTGLVAPLAIAVSPDNATVIVADGSTKQQFRFFSNSTGAEGTPLGQLGGYATDATVYNDKFMFKNSKEFYGVEKAFITFQPDGTFWVGDLGNCRVLHFAANKTFIEAIMNVGYFYSANADRNNVNRIFANYLEYEADWTLPLSPTNGSWRLKKNWTFPITLEYDNQFDRLKYVTTLSNGRTYAFLHHKIPLSNYHRWHLVELPPTGNLRFIGDVTGFTGNQFDMAFGLNDDGSLISITGFGVGIQATMKKKALTGFDGSNNPIWGSATTIATTPAAIDTDPINENGIRNNPITSSGLAIYHSPEPSGGYHLGAVPLGGTTWKWRAAPSTFTSYRGEFPDDGVYDTGNTVLNGGNFHSVIDNVILWGYHGEFWKQSQTNKWNLFSDNGLFLYQFGITGIEAVRIGEAAPGIAGNVYWGGFMKLPNGDLILVHNDENSHGGLGVWRIKGVDTIQTHVVAISKAGTPSLPAPNYIDLLDDLPARSNLTGNVGRWTMDTITEYFYIKTNITTYKKGDRDIRIYSGGEGKIIKCNMGSYSGLSIWKITCKIAYPESVEPGDNLIEILDSANKVILRLNRVNTSFPYITLRANSTNIMEIIQGSNNIDILADLTISVSGSNITVTYKNYTPVVVSAYDGTAVLSSPKYIQFRTVSVGAAHVNDVANLKFYPQ